MDLQDLLLTMIGTLVFKPIPGGHPKLPEARSIRRTSDTDVQQIKSISFMTDYW
jgi:hypothetical protein